MTGTADGAHGDAMQRQPSSPLTTMRSTPNPALGTSGIATGTSLRVHWLPPRPAAGVIVQTVLLHRDSLGTLRSLQTRFGDVFTLRLATARPIVVVAAPQAVAGRAGAALFNRRKAPLDAVLREEIETRRRDGDLGEDLIGDVLRDEPEVPAEAIADELLVVLIAAQEPLPSGRRRVRIRQLWPGDERMVVRGTQLVPHRGGLVRVSRR